MQRKFNNMSAEDLLSVLPDDEVQIDMLKYLHDQINKKVTVRDIAKHTRVDEKTGIKTLYKMLKNEQITINDGGEVNITDTGKRSVISSRSHKKF